MGTDPQRGMREREGLNERERKKKRDRERKRAQIVIGERERGDELWEREREELKDKSQRKQKVKKGIKYKYFGLQLCYNAIIHLGWHYSIIANFLQW